MSICAWCNVKACGKSNRDVRPAKCPMGEGTWLDKAMTAYELPENRKLAQAAAHTEKTGYCQWTRLQEIAEFSKTAQFKKLGLAFCVGLQREAKIVADFYRNQGFEVVTAVCCVGGVEKEGVGIPPEDKFSPTQFEAMCNPIGQAMLFNERNTDFNVVLGLCVGHDSLFFKHSDAPATVLAAKDRVLGHNPLAAVYCANSYYSKLHQGHPQDFYASTSREEWLGVKKQKAVERYNELFAPVYDQKWGAVLDDTHVEYLAELVELLQSDATLLDAACGTGKYWGMIQERGVNVVGVDQSQVMIDQLMQKHKDATVHTQSLQDLNIHRKFDAVICVDSMENVPPEDWPSVLSNIKRHLEEGGLFYFTVEIEDAETIAKAYESARSQGLPVVRGEVALEGYHYYPDDHKVQQWLNEASFKAIREGSGDGYKHYICRLK